MATSSVSRRHFLSATAGAAAGLTLVPRDVLGGQGGLAPSDRVNIAVIGAGGRGAAVATELVAGGHNIVALADIDLAGMDARVARSTRGQNGPNEARLELQSAYAAAKRYTDFRRLLEQQRDVDAVLIGTPDHTHAVIAKAAMELGKHVYVEKPLTWSVHEARVLRDVARRNPRLVTQMGNQGQSTDGARLINEWIQTGIIGTVREVHLSTDRPIWPQGVPRPVAGAAALSPTAYTSPLPPPPGSQGAGNDWTPPRRLAQVTARAISGEYTPPDGLDWDLFLGPAPQVPYHPIYHPFNWRGWIDWGVGAIGDIASHTLNHAYWALDLQYPETVEATSSPFGLDEQGAPASYPAAMEIVFRYAGTAARAPVTMYWRDGGLWAPRPALLPEGVSHRRSAIIIGDKGLIMHDAYGNNPQLYPESLRDAAAGVPQKYERVPGQQHAIHWADAIRNHGKANSDFEYSSRLTENMLLGIVAVRTGQGVQIRYDGATGTVTNNSAANQYLTREARRGWELGF